MQLGDGVQRGRVGAHDGPLPRPGALRHRLRAAGLPRCGAERHLALRRLGLARARRDGVHERPGERQPHQPGRPSRRARRGPARRQAAPLRLRARRLSRALDRRRVHPVPQLAALRRTRPRPALRARRQRLGPRLRARRLPDHGGPDGARAVGRGRVTARARRRPRRPRPHLRRGRRRQRHPQGLRRGQRGARRHRHPQLRRRPGLRHRAAALPAPHRRVRRCADRPLSVRHRPRQRRQRLRRGPRARRRGQPLLRATPRVGGQRLPGVGRRRRHRAQRRLRRRRR